MHELALAQSIIDVATQQAGLHKARHVNSVHLLIGDAVAVDPESLRFSFEMLAAQVKAIAGAVLEIESVTHRARCRHCGSVYTIMQYVVQCPTCQGSDADIVSGTEFQVLDMDVDDDLED